VHPYLERTFSGNAALLAAIDYIFRFVDRTNVSTLGAVGLLTLVYSSVSLIGNVETALNEIWGARSQRPLLRQMTDYVSLLVTTPILVVVATTFATAAQSSQAVQFLRDTLQLGGVIDFLLRFTSVVVVGAALFALFEILPNAPVRPASALLGATVSALLWQGLLILHVRFQMGVAGYSALYSVLGAVPIFLVWTYFSWVTVLVGAQVAVSHQNQHAVGEAVGARHLDQALRERVGLAITALVVSDFRSGTRRSEAGLAERLAVARASAAEVLARLVQARILARAVDGREAFYVPGRDPSTVRVSDVRDALRRQPGTEGLRALVEDRFPPGLRAQLDAAEEEGLRSARNLTLQELSGRSAEEPVRPDPPPPGRSLPPVSGPAASGPH
jgi:membrane protein